MRKPKTVPHSSDLDAKDADVVEIDPSEYDYLVEQYTEKDLDDLFLAYGVDLNAYDDNGNDKKRRIKRRKSHGQKLT